MAICIYDFNIHTGKELNTAKGTLGERVVNSLASTIIEKDVSLCFDRFCTTVDLIKTIQYPAVGTCIANRKDLPKIKDMLQRGESIFQGSADGLMFDVAGYERSVGVE